MTFLVSLLGEGGILTWFLCHLGNEVAHCNRGWGEGATFHLNGFDAFKSNCVHLVWKWCYVQLTGVDSGIRGPHFETNFHHPQLCGLRRTTI